MCCKLITHNTFDWFCLTLSVTHTLTQSEHTYTHSHTHSPTHTHKHTHTHTNIHIHTHTHTHAHTHTQPCGGACGVINPCILCMYDRSESCDPSDNCSRIVIVNSTSDVPDNDRMSKYLLLLIPSHFGWG